MNNALKIWKGKEKSYELQHVKGTINQKLVRVFLCVI